MLYMPAQTVIDTTPTVIDTTPTIYSRFRNSELETLSLIR